MNLKFILSICSILMLIACTNQKNNKNVDPQLVKPYPHIININEGFKNSTEITLSSIADSIKYIVLSKEKDILIKNFPVLQMTDSAYFISPGGHFYRFDLTGKLLNSIGQIGRGPTEYMPGSSFTINPSSNKTYVNRNYLHDYISFNPSGNFIEKLSILDADNIWEFVCLSDSIFMFTFQFWGRYMGAKTTEEMILCGLFDINGDKIQVIEHPANKNAPLSIDYSKFAAGPPNYSFFNNEIVLNYLTDTVYKINNNSIYPGFIFFWDNIPHRQTFEELYYIQTEPIKKTSRIRYFFETPGKAYFGVAYLDKYYLFEYDKYTGLTKSMLTDENNFGLINDLDGGANYYPKWTNRKGDIWIVYDDAYNFKKTHNEDLLLKSDTVYPNRKENLRQFLNTLNIDDNPVLKVVYLK
ncbi:MAG: 6-bladed beta-propeller [Bacteroidales bacterium]|nr:6-bladed beta-propeller [Bacteroidales bacterium]